MPADSTATDRLTREQIHYTVPREVREGKYQCPFCHKWHLNIETLTCFTPSCEGNEAKRVAARCWEEVHGREGKPPKQDKPSGSLNLVEYAMAKQLDVGFLKEHFGLYEAKPPCWSEVTLAVGHPYFDEKGAVVSTIWRYDKGKLNEPGKPVYLYGGRFFQILEGMAKDGNARPEIYLCEGQSNVHTLSQLGFPALGLPGVRNWKPEWANLQCLQKALRIYFLFDMRDGVPENAAVVGAYKVAHSFEPGKVLGVQLPMKDVSELWTSACKFAKDFETNPEQDFLSELRKAVFAARPLIRQVEEADKLKDIGAEVLDACPILRDFVELTLPRTESDVNNLVCDFLACAGTALGGRVSAEATGLHHPATFWLIIAETGRGKGGVWYYTNQLFSLALPGWSKILGGGTRSKQALIRQLKGAACTDITWADQDGEEHSKSNPDYTEGRLLLRFSEIAELFKGIKAEWSTLSEGLRDAYDGATLKNELSKKGDSDAVQEGTYTLAIHGDVTPWQIEEVVSSSDIENGLANRFIWLRAFSSKSLARPQRLPDYSDLAQRLRRVLTAPIPNTEAEFSPEALEAWEAWYDSLPPAEGKLQSMLARTRANALRVCLTLAALDESRLALEGAAPVVIQEQHVRAAAAIMARHRATVAQFLGMERVKLPAQAPGSAKSAMLRDVEKLLAAVEEGGGRVTASEFCRMFSGRTLEKREGIAKAAGLQEGEEDGARGHKVKVWKRG